MNNIKNILKSFTFRFKDCVSLLDRNIINSILYIGVLILVLSYFYHFNYIESLSMSDYLINIFTQKYIVEFLVSLVFISILCWNMCIISKSILTKNRYIIKFKNIFNMYSHIFTILFFLDLFFIFIFKDYELNSNMQLIYVWSSIIIAILFTIVYPLLFLKYLCKNDIKILSTSNSKSKLIKYLKSFKIFSLLSKYFKNIYNILFLDDDFYMNTLGKKSFYKCFVYYIFMSVIFTLLKLKFNPNIINYDYDFSLKSYSIMEIIKEYYLNTSTFIIIVIIISFIYFSYAKIKDFKRNNFLYTLKISIFTLYTTMFISLGETIQRKIINLSTISPSILASQSLAVIISILTYITIIYIVFFFLKRILRKSFDTFKKI